MLAFRLPNRVDKNISAQMLLWYYEQDQDLDILLVEGSIKQGSEWVAKDGTEPGRMVKMKSSPVVDFGLTG